MSSEQEMAPEVARAREARKALKGVNGHVTSILDQVGRQSSSMLEVADRLDRMADNVGDVLISMTSRDDKDCTSIFRPTHLKKLLHQEAARLRGTAA